jgi:hypothetical protein
MLSASYLFFGLVLLAHFASAKVDNDDLNFSSTCTKDSKGISVATFETHWQEFCTKQDESPLNKFDSVSETIALHYDISRTLDSINATTKCRSSDCYAAFQKLESCTFSLTMFPRVSLLLTDDQVQVR